MAERKGAILPDGREVLHAPDASRIWLAEPSEVDALLASGEWVRAPGVMQSFKLDDDDNPVLTGSRLMTWEEDDASARERVRD